MEAYMGRWASSEQTIAVKEIFATNDVRTLITNHLGVSTERVAQEALCELGLAGDAMRNLIGWCHETQQPIDLQLCVDDATLARIWSNVLRFQCPHCGTKHETKVQRLTSRPFSLEPPQTKRTRHQHTARSVDAKSVTNVLARA
jgi:endogenous inhibitor of DNA gyrase (YacG/DUF329 family)